MEISRGRRAPYTQVAHWVVLSSVSRPASLLYQVLSMHVNYSRGDEEVWPSRAALADILGYATARRVDPLIAELVAIGAIDVERRKDDKGEHDTNKYLVHETPPPGYAGVMSLGDYYVTRRKTSPKPVDNSEGVVSHRTLGVVSARTLGVVSHRTHELEVLELEEFQLEKPKISPRASRSPVAALPDRFDDFWELYPKKVSKADARRAWVKIKDRDDEKILSAVEKFRVHVRKHEPDAKYVANPATWLNGQRWDDELVSASPSAGGLVERDGRMFTQKNADAFDLIRRLEEKEAHGADRVLQLEGASW